GYPATTPHCPPKPPCRPRTATKSYPTHNHTLTHAKTPKHPNLLTATLSPPTDLRLLYPPLHKHPIAKKTHLQYRVSRKSRSRVQTEC
ncbi:hypothetical protein AVEN_211071-1, partial [Araneus ventricosus]